MAIHEGKTLKLIPEIKEELGNAKFKKEAIEKLLSDRMRTVISKEIESIKEIYGASPSSIDVEFINTSSIGHYSDHYIMQQVNVRI